MDGQDKQVQSLAVRVLSTGGQMVRRKKAGQLSRRVVPPENSSRLCLCGFSCVVMMQPANFRDGYDFSLFRCFDWSRFRTVLIQ